MNKYERLRERNAEEIRLIVANAPAEPEKRHRYVVDQCLMLEDHGFEQADCREIEKEVRERLGVPQW